MPLGTTGDISNLIRSLIDQAYSDFKGFPDNLAQAIENWADIADALMSGVIPASTTTEIAREALKGVMSGISNEAANAIPLLYSGFAAYATTLAGGMTAAGFVGTPPPNPIAYAPTGLVTNDAKIEAINLASALVAWAKTGTATPISGGSPINWN